MTSSLRFLHLEDDSNDAELIHSMLAADGICYSVVRVETRHDFLAALEKGGFNLIFADYSLPSFDGMSALAIAQEKCPDVPFILVSGTLGEDAAIESLKRGATDYILKQGLSRLVPAVRRTLREIEERKKRIRLQEQLCQSQKMEAFGQFAGEIAHDYNNQLSVIIGYCELAMKQLEPDNPIQEKLENIRTAAAKSAALTRKLLALGRKQDLQPQLLQLNDVIVESEKILRQLIREDIDLVCAQNTDLGYVKLDPTQVDQIILNLVINARDSMPKGGKLTIETANVELDEEYASTHPDIQAGPYVMLAISDTGKGMDKQTMSQIFDPFFTTKEKSKGSGLGLAAVHGIVTQSGGHIWVYSEPEIGTTFKIYFPRVKIPAEDKAGMDAKLRQSLKTILFVEDEKQLCTLFRLVIEKNGYRVLMANHGEEALDICRSYQGTIDLLVTDMILPGMDGKELAKKTLPLQPNMKVIYMSGYTETTMSHRGKLDPDMTFLPKPIITSTLLEKISELLNTSQ